MKNETYGAARVRLLGQLAAVGWTVHANLKRPWAEPPSKAFRVTFHAQAVYRGAHSTWLDIRGMNHADFIAAVAKQN